MHFNMFDEYCYALAAQAFCGNEEITSIDHINARLQKWLSNKPVLSNTYIVSLAQYMLIRRAAIVCICTMHQPEDQDNPYEIMTIDPIGVVRAWASAGTLGITGNLLPLGPVVCGAASLIALCTHNVHPKNPQSMIGYMLAFPERSKVFEDPWGQCGITKESMQSYYDSVIPNLYVMLKQCVGITSVGGVAIPDILHTSYRGEIERIRESAITVCAGRYCAHAKIADKTLQENVMSCLYSSVVSGNSADARTDLNEYAANDRFCRVALSHVYDLTRELNAGIAASPASSNFIENIYVPSEARPLSRIHEAHQADSYSNGLRSDASEL